MTSGGGCASFVIAESLRIPQTDRSPDPKPRGRRLKRVEEDGRPTYKVVKEQCLATRHASSAKVEPFVGYLNVIYQHFEAEDDCVAEPAVLRNHAPTAHLDKTNGKSPEKSSNAKTHQARPGVPYTTNGARRRATRPPRSR